MGEKTIFEQAVDAWGPVSQAGMVNEEAGELITVLNQWIRGRAKADRVAEEVADMAIMLDQIKFIMQAGGVDPQEFDRQVIRFRDLKLARLHKLLKQEAKAHE